jgi:serine protease Do
MKGRPIIGRLLALVLIGPSAQAAPVTLRRAQQEVFHQAIANAQPYCVKIIADSTRLPTAMTENLVVTPEDEQQELGPNLQFAVAEGPSTGVIYSPDGLIVTSSFHFVRTPSSIAVHLHDGRVFPAKLLGRDQVRKLAFLKIQAAGLPVAEWVGADAIQVGQWAIALGWGFGGKEVAPSVGVLSAINRMGGNAVQTDANLSPANYGGPLINIRGQVIGICVPIGTVPGETAGVELYDSGIGFAIPGAVLQQVATRLANGETIYRGLIGINLPRMPDQLGAMIGGLAVPSPAKDAGLQVGDRIVQIDQHPIPHVHTLLRHMNYRAAGEQVHLIILRGQERMRFTLTLTAMKTLGDIESPPPDDPSETPDEK